MPEYRAPGVFIEEIERGPRPIKGVATSTAALLGQSERGPARPRLVASLSEYERHFGGAAGEDDYLPDAVRGFFENGGRRAYICRIAGAGAARASLSAGGLEIEARGPGEWGNRLYVRVGESSARSGADSRAAGFRLQIAYWCDLGGAAPPDPFANPASVPGPTLLEDFDDLVWDDPASADYYERRLHDASALIRVAATGALTAPPTSDFAPLSGGANGAAPVLRDYEDALAELARDDYREVALLAAPGVDEGIAKALCAHCERNRFRFAVIDAPRDASDVGTLDPRRALETSYAAFYCPWIYVASRDKGAPKLVPPSGHVLGVYARTDVERGVWKAPANEALRSALDLEHDVDRNGQAVLSLRGVNAIRRFPGRGMRVWGARTLSSNSLWKYVSVRRLFIFLERSIYEGTQWVVFEPNDEKLWARVRDTVRLFLRTQWRDGALTGMTEDEAFTIACDRSTMTQDDIVNGRLVCEIGVAPVRPAEFVIFRIFQNTAEAQS